MNEDINIEGRLFFCLANYEKKEQNKKRSWSIQVQMKNFIQGHFKLANLKCVKYTDKHKR